MERVDQFDRALNSPRGKPSPGQFRNFRCPLHDDRKASAYWTWDLERGITMGCHRCGSDDHVRLHMLVELRLGWDLTDLSVHKGATKDGAGRSRIELARYCYTDRHGVEVFTVVRFLPKDWLTIWPDPKNRSEQRPLYRLPEVWAEPTTVWLCEGEKDVEALAELGLCATTTPFGASTSGSRLRDEQLAPLMGKTVKIVVDRDGAGYRLGMERLCQLTAEGIDAEVLEPLDGNDASDHLAVGHGIDDLVSLTVADLRSRLVACEAPPTLAEVLEHLPSQTFTGCGRAPESQSALMLALAQIARSEGKLDDLAVSIDRFQLHTPIGRATVSRNLAGLETKGWLTRERPADDDEGNHFAYRYTITVPASVLAEWRGVAPNGTHCEQGGYGQMPQREQMSVGQPQAFLSPVPTRSVPFGATPNFEGAQLLTADLGHDANRNRYTDPDQVSHSGIGLRGERILQHLAVEGPASTKGLQQWLQQSNGTKYVRRDSLKRILDRMEKGGLIARNDAQRWEAVDTTVEGHDEAAARLGTAGARKALAAKAVERKRRYATWAADKAIERLLDHCEDDARFVELDDGAVVDTLTGELLGEDDLWAEITAADAERMAEIDIELFATGGDPS